MTHSAFAGAQTERHVIIWLSVKSAMVVVLVRVLRDGLWKTPAVNPKVNSTRECAQRHAIRLIFALT